MSQSFVRGNRELIKAMNRSLVLNAIRRENQLSRTQLVSYSGLSTGAVSQITTDLLNNSWLLETGESEFTGGRRQTFLRLNPRAGYAVGAKLMEDRVVCAITDFEARIIQHEDRQISNNDRHDTLRQVAAIIDDTIRLSGISRDKMLGVGIGVAGVVDPHTGSVLYSPYSGWRNLPLAKLLEEQIKLPVYVENDVNTLTLSEYLFGAGRYHADFIVFTVGRGIGMGMMLAGQLYQGLGGGAGEVGHIIVDLEKEHTEGLGAGTLEANAADPVVVAAVFPADAHQKSLSDVLALVQNGDDRAIDALAHSGHYLGVGLATLINLLHPPLIIVSGEGLIAGDYRLKPMMDAMQTYAFDGLAEGVQIIIEPTDDQAWVRGAASLVIGKVFESPLVASKASA
ncbi:MAG: ROK family protein [Anaerolineae bacterium]|nr:ROK family protein [Anaerolineae bacterium]